MKAPTTPRLLPLLLVLLVSLSHVSAQSWEAAEPVSLPAKRHENAMASANGKLYLIGGRGQQLVNEYDPKTDNWAEKAPAPIEMHHFQAVSFNQEIYVIGAFTGGFPHEKPIPDVYIFNPSKNEWRKGPSLPVSRLRGAAGAFAYNGKIYLVAGIQDGHYDQQVAWFDEFDPKTGEWKVLPDAPRPRDHVSVAELNGRVYVAGGRLSSAKTKQTLNLTIPELDIYDFKSGKWSTSTENIPTQRAGNTAVAFNNKLLFIGGESAAQVPAHQEVEAFNPKTGKWELFPRLLQGRHGTQAVVLNGKVYIAAGSANRGGGPELDTMEILKK